MHKLGLHVLHPEVINNMLLLNTVEEDMKAFTKRDVEGAKAARKLYAKMLYPSNADFKWLIKNNQINNCGVLVRNIDTDQEMWVKDISALKCNTVRGNPTVVASDCIKIPKDIANLKKTVFLTADIFFFSTVYRSSYP